MDAAKTCNLASKDSYSAILSDCRAAMEKLRAPEDAIREYLDRVAGVLDGLVNLHKLISLPFLIVLVIVVLELSIADPGTAAGWTVLFASLGLSSDFVGLFLAFELLTANYNAAYGALQMGLEAIESAACFDAIGMVVLALAVGFVIGFAVFLVMNLSTWLTSLLWNGATGDTPTPWSTGATPSLLATSTR